MLMKNVRIFTMEDLVIEKGFISCVNGKIVSIGEMKELSSESVNGQKVLDLEGLSVYPGFVDAHTHLGLYSKGYGYEQSDINESSELVTPELMVLDAIDFNDKSFKEALKSGVTTVLVSPGSSNPVAGQISAVKTARDLNGEFVLEESLGIKFSLGENPKNEHKSKIKSRMKVALIIKEYLLKAQSYMKLEGGKEGLNQDLKCKSLFPLLNNKTKAYFHVHRECDIITALNISKEFSLDPILIHATEGHFLLEKLKRENAKVLVGPIICDKTKQELLNFKEDLIKDLNEKGILTAIISDSPEVSSDLLRLSALLTAKKGLDRKLALKNITINPAKICKIDDRVGSIKEGKDADFVIFKGDFFDFYSEPEMVIVNGVISYKKSN